MKKTYHSHEVGQTGSEVGSEQGYGKRRGHSLVGVLFISIPDFIYSLPARVHIPAHPCRTHWPRLYALSPWLSRRSKESSSFTGLGAGGRSNLFSTQQVLNTSSRVAQAFSIVAIML